MVVTVSTADPRSVKALALLSGADRWQRGRTRDGRSFYAVPSQRTAGLFHMADTRGCSCRDFQRRNVACKHMIAVRLHVAKLGADCRSKPVPAYAEVYGPAQAHDSATCRLAICPDC
jgi:hypothetical protein